MEEKQNDEIELNELQHDDDLQIIMFKLEDIEMKIIELQNKMNVRDNNDAINKLEKSFSLLKKLYRLVSNLCQK